MMRMAAVLCLGLVLGACENLEDEDSILIADEFSEDYSERKSLSLSVKAGTLMADMEGICSCTCDVDPGTSYDEDMDIRGLSRDDCTSDTEGEDCETTEGRVGTTVDCSFRFRPVVDTTKSKIKALKSK